VLVVVKGAELMFSLYL